MIKLISTIFVLTVVQANIGFDIDGESYTSGNVKWNPNMV